MKTICGLLIVTLTAFLFLFSTSCRKGRNSPSNVSVYIDTTGIYSAVDEVFCEYNDVNRSYITEKIREDLVQAFYQDLRFYLKKNNCISVTSNQLYTVKVSMVSLRESISSMCYVDSCLTDCYGYTVFDNVYLSTVEYKSQLTVFTRDGVSLGSFNERDEQREKTSGRNSCNRPHVRCIRRTQIECVSA